ncbi:NADP-dependent succinic semialdehyde dehydrogenase [Streptomyces chromofuscus]|uniref:NADP-dependent succinic semialdehyde dehydrogenase n=1 Tax=Streptomyces chromofuscus TaxID=42881 RepID=A0A7M2TA08_STRCW|nr:NADP-dependent succinic semialdehyde dehydrogenase [Streptomyces chromofuscus]QOV44763.1 NADP-dependent succinic semialdehyde dehydrogenase [Streptomyces chromofuscus]GGT00427.1 succinate-semialdehyde dehydrogenase [NADP(+)] 1 [Streptomyces chromofuscus]
MPIATVNPATGELIEEFAALTKEQIDQRLTRAEAAAVTLRATDFGTRARWMRAAADLVEAEAAHTARRLTVEMGKPIVQARAEVLKCAHAMRFYADNAESLLADQALADPRTVNASVAYTAYQPLGVVLAVMPWNYPMWQVIRFAAPALMAGNVGLLKHASNVPQTAMYLDTLFERAGFPAGSFQTLLVGAADVEAVLRDRRVAAVTLTGSEPAGRSVAAVAGSEVKKVVLELGGSDPFVVLPSADVHAAARTAVSARTMNNGQSCIAAKRFIVHTEVYEAFVEAFVAGTKALTVGDPLDEGTDVGPIATESGRRELVDLVDDAVAKGAVLRCGGSAAGTRGWFFEPAVLEEVTPAMRVYREEAFGPLAVMHRVDDIEQAVTLANDTAFGLSSSVWTTDPDEERLLISRIDAGAVFVNGMSVSYPELPFGGVKASGVGRELAAEGIREFCNLKTIWKN